MVCNGCYRNTWSIFFSEATECIWWQRNEQVCDLVRQIWTHANDFSLAGNVKIIKRTVTQLHWTRSERKHSGRSIFNFTSRTSTCWLDVTHMRKEGKPVPAPSWKTASKILLLTAIHWTKTSAQLVHMCWMISQLQYIWLEPVDPDSSQIELAASAALPHITRKCVSNERCKLHGSASVYFSHPSKELRCIAAWYAVRNS
jgi:hypothetical protein